MIIGHVPIFTFWLQFLSMLDVVVIPIYFFLLWLFVRITILTPNKHNPTYKYFWPGLLCKLFGAIGVCVVYSFYYNGGDTTTYFVDSIVMNKLMFINPGAYFHILFNHQGVTDYYAFNSAIGFPENLDDPKSFMVVRIISPITFVCFNSFFLTTMVLASLAYIGVWRMYRTFMYEFPHLRWQIAIPILFFPSVFFWGSGILKDTITFSCLGHMIFCFYSIIIRGEKKFVHTIQLIIAIMIILAIKPYIFVGVVPAFLVFVLSVTNSRFKNEILRYMFFPFMAFCIFGGGFGFMSLLSSSLGAYSFDHIFDRAVETQKDFKNEFYQGNTFDIGELEPTFTGLISKFPLAVNAALFRPFITEVKNPVMLLSAIENFYVLVITIIALLRSRIFGFFKVCLTNHLLLFSFVFSMFFSFSVGITTANFGSLVRYKIPMLPFYIVSVLIANEMYKKMYKEKQEAAKLLNKQAVSFE